MAGESVGGWAQSLSAFAVRNAKAVVVVWALIVAGLNVVIPQLEVVVEHDSTSFVPLDAQAVVGLARMDQEFGDGRSASFVQVIAHRAGGLTDADRQYFRDLVPRLKADRTNVTFVQALDRQDVRKALTSDDGQAMYLPVGIPGATGAPAANTQIDAVRTISQAEPPAGLEVVVTGVPATIRDMVHTIESSLIRITVAIVVVIAIIVQLLYRSVPVTLLILGVVGIALGTGRALVAFCGEHLFGISTFTGSVMTAVILAAATDYAVFMISRYQEFRRAGVVARDAADQAGAKVAGIVVGSALTVAIANAAMLLADVAFFRTTGPAVAVAVLSTLVLSLTLIPAVLVLAGERGLMEPRPRNPTGGFWDRMAGLVATVPGRVLLVGVVPLALLAGLYPAMDVNYDERGNQPANTESNRGFALVNEHFPMNEVTPTYVVISTDHDLRTPEDLAAVERAADEVSRVNGIREVRAITRPKGTPITEASVGFQAGEVGEELDDAADEVDDGAADAQKLVDGAGELDDGARELDDGARELDDGTGKLADGAGRAVDGAEELLAGTRRLETGLRRLRDGSAQARDGSDRLRLGAAQLADALEQGSAQAQIAVDGLGMAYDALSTKSLTCGLDPACSAARDGIRQIYQAERDQLVPGMRQAARAARQIADGSGDLNVGLTRLTAGLDAAREGAGQMKDGQRTMAAKLDELADGADELHAGSGELADGTAELAKGTAKVSDGTEEAKSSIEELSNGLTQAADYLNELGDAARDPAVSGFYLPTEAFDDGRLVTAADLFLSKDSNTTRLIVMDRDDANARPAAIRIAEVQKAVHRALKGTTLDDADVELTGSAQFNVDLHDLSKADFRLVTAIALLAVLIILVVMLRSLLAPLFLVGSVVLSYAAAMGLAVLVWQEWLGHPLDWSVPGMAFVMLVAVGADYNLLLMKRIQEEAADGSRAGIGRALAVTGGVITAAGLIFAASMFAMMTAEAVGLAQTGFTIGMGLLIDTFIVRTFIVPSAAALLGPAMWWPRRTDAWQVEPGTAPRLVDYHR